MTKIIFFLSAFIFSAVSLFAQEPPVYDLAFIKREYIGKNDIYTVVFRNASGKTVTKDGYIRASAAENKISLYSYNTIHRNYDIMEIAVPDIRSIEKAKDQTIIKEEKPPAVTSRGILKAVGIAAVLAGLALLIFYEEL